MKSRWIEAALAAVALCASACGGVPLEDDASATDGTLAGADGPTALAVTKSGLEVALYSLRGETLSRGSNRVRLELTRESETTAASEDAPDLDVELTTFMPAMGHGASEQPELVTTDENRYTFDKVVLNMPGLWELHVAVSGDVDEELVFEFDVE